MKLLKVTAYLAMVTAMALSSNARADELIGNLGFENPMGTFNTAATFGNWVGFGLAGTPATVVQSTVDPFAGTMQAEIAIGGALSSFAGIQQEFATTVGQNYTFSFFAKTNGGTYDLANEYRIEWINAAGVEVSRNQLTSTFLPGAYAQYSVSGAAPVGAAKGRAVIALQSFQAAPATGTGTARIDSTSVQGPAAIPEPGSIALLGLGALGMVARRRRS